VVDRSQTHYLNSDFDLSLRPRPRQLEQPKLVRQVCELSVQAVLGAAEADSVVVRAQVPAQFLEHLEGCGACVPTLLLHPQVDPAKRLRPFGWNAEAAALNGRHRQPVDHPDLAVVRRVNSRSFALALEKRIGTGHPAGAVVDRREDLEAFLSRSPAPGGWVIKAEHGNSGLANRRLAGSRLSAADLRFVEDRLAEDDHLLVEPWLPREQDWCVVFDVPFDPDTMRVHETVCTADGALIGALFEPGAGAATPWLDELGTMAERVAARLDAESYFGPVCVDAFTWRDGGRSSLRAFVDLNCRLSMSDAAYRLWRRIAPERTFFYRFFNRRKIDLSADLSRALAALGDQRYDRDSRRGILLASPLRLGAAGQTWRPGKLAVVFIANGRDATFELERWFRERFEV
jgi:hypothetical protein